MRTGWEVNYCCVYMEQEPDSQVTKGPGLLECAQFVNFPSVNINYFPFPSQSA